MVVKCPVCGYRFNSASNQACNGCPVGSKCERICCPNCYYGWVESTTLVSKLTRLFKKGDTVGRS